MRDTGLARLRAKQPQFPLQWLTLLSHQTWASIMSTYDMSKHLTLLKAAKETYNKHVIGRETATYVTLLNNACWVRCMLTRISSDELPLPHEDEIGL